MTAETPQGAVGKDAPSSLSEPRPVHWSSFATVCEALAWCVGHLEGLHYPVNDRPFIQNAMRLALDPASARVVETAETQLAEARAEIERLTNHYHDDTHVGDGWWECNSCHRRVSSTADKMQEKLDAVREWCHKRFVEGGEVIAQREKYDIEDVVAAERMLNVTRQVAALLKENEEAPSNRDEAPE